jgi:hypothetical protein
LSGVPSNPNLGKAGEEKADKLLNQQKEFIRKGYVENPKTTVATVQPTNLGGDTRIKNAIGPVEEKLQYGAVKDMQAALCVSANGDLGATNDSPTRKALRLYRQSPGGSGLKETTNGVATIGSLSEALGIAETGACIPIFKNVYEKMFWSNTTQGPVTQRGKPDQEKLRKHSEELASRMDTANDYVNQFREFLKDDKKVSEAGNPANLRAAGPHLKDLDIEKTKRNLLQTRTSLDAIRAAVVALQKVSLIVRSIKKDAPPLNLSGVGNALTPDVDDLIAEVPPKA